VEDRALARDFLASLCAAARAEGADLANEVIQNEKNCHHCDGADEPEDAKAVRLRPVIFAGKDDFGDVGKLAACFKSEF